MSRRRDRDFPWHRDPYFGLNTVIPKPNAKISLRRARIEFKLDNCCAEQLDINLLPLDVLSFLVWNSSMWMRFWAKRHPDPLRRAWLRREVERDQADAREMLVLVERLLEKQGVVLQCQ